MHKQIDINLISKFSHIYVGFSGGADSTALLTALWQVAHHSKLTIEAVHFEHGIRGKSSREDAEWCRKFCESRNIPFRQINLHLQHDTKNLESTARQLRLAAWGKIVSSGNEAVALGQHADDRLENFFLRMMRGSNATGLTSLRSSQRINNIIFLRPLINIRRSEIEYFLINSGITDWCNDHTNRESLYRRNALRNKVIPLFQKEFPESDKAIIKSIDTLKTDAEFIENSAIDLYNKNIKLLKEKSKGIHISLFSEMHPALIPRVMRLWLSDFFSADTIPTYDFITRFNDSITNYQGERILIPFNATFSILIEKSIVSIEKKLSKTAPPTTVEWDLKNQPTIKWGNLIFSVFHIDNIPNKQLIDRECNSVFFDQQSIPKNLIIRNRENGDKMVPFGKNSNVKLKKILQNSPLTLNQKKEIPVITTRDENNIIWIPGVKRANFANITNATKTIIQLKTETANANIKSAYNKG